jgi:catechol 1,2-dioxygenase
VNGAVGKLLLVQGRHNMRPAHIHFMFYKDGIKTQFSQLYSADDPNLETDVQFGVTKALIGEYVARDDERGRAWSLEHTFVVRRGEAQVPVAPISGKNEGERAELVVLRRGDFAA